ncbi:MAG: DNA primase [Acidimicrobiales bacterium]|jgi:DNA primase
MQKNPGEHLAGSIARHRVVEPDRTMTDYPVVTQALDLVYLAYEATVTFPLWTAAIATANRPG